MAASPTHARPGGGRLPGRTALLGAVLALAGCISEEREVLLGEQIAMQINAQVPLVADGPVNRYVNELGRTLAANSERPELEYRFYVVDSPALNAFALPGGHVYVNRGLLERTRNQSELAGVLAHEIGHVAARHGAKNLQRQLRTRSIAATMYHLILGRGPLLDQEALDLGGALWNAQHSRRAEVEADRLAVRYLVRSGVDPRGMLSLFTALWQEEHRAGASDDVSLFSTHPGTLARLEQTRDKIRDVLPRHAGRDLAVDSDGHAGFLARLQQLPRPTVVPLLLPPGHPDVPGR